MLETYLLLKKRKIDFLVNSSYNLLLEKKEEEAMFILANEKNYNAIEANFKDWSSLPKPRDETTWLSL